jgi:hypothetical protein
MTGQFGVSRSAYYRREKQGVSDRREREEGEQTAQLRFLQEEYQGRYGVPRLQAELRGGDRGKPERDRETADEVGFEREKAAAV